MKAINRILFIWVFLGTSLTTQAEMALPGLEGPVKLVRDSSGIPHIFAENEHDVFFMQGWVHAQDRLFQMDTARRQIAWRSCLGATRWRRMCCSARWV